MICRKIRWCKWGYASSWCKLLW